MGHEQKSAKTFDSYLAGGTFVDECRVVRYASKKR